ncbi:hypothetical protein NL676_001348 [Syzygium grande]|nr:hypothetical protein NL676_001348 [Syzygium grande]
MAQMQHEMEMLESVVDDFIQQLDPRTMMAKVATEPSVGDGMDVTARVVEWYPVTGREHEGVSPKAPIPVWILVGDGVDIIEDHHDGLVADDWVGEVLEDHHDAEWEEVSMSSMGIASADTMVELDQVEEEALRRVD